jgi:hypothetical protein
MGETHFDILGLLPVTDFGKITSAYQQKKAEYKGDPVRLRLVEQAYRVLINPMSLRKYLQEMKPVESATSDIGKDSTLPDSLSVVKKKPEIEKTTGKRQKTEIFEFDREVHPPPTPSVSGVRKNVRQRTELFEPGSDEKPFTAPSADRLKAPASPPKRQRTVIGTADASAPTDHQALSMEPGKRPRTIPAGLSPEKNEFEKKAYVICMYAGEKKEFSIKEGENIIGRPPANGPTPDVPLADADRFISRRHAVILVKGEEYQFQDMGSDNGSLLNGKRLEPAIHYPLKDGDVIEIEKRQLIFKIS